LLCTAAVAGAQDTRNVSEPHFPAPCAVLRARLAAPAGVLSAADEAAPDTRRVQAAIDACAPGGVVDTATRKMSRAPSLARASRLCSALRPRLQRSTTT